MSTHHLLRYKIVLLIITLLCASLAHATFKQREERWARQILEYLTIGKAEWLSDNTGKFLSISTAADGATKGGVILLHDEGQHPDWPDVISPLRRGLPAHGYATLSLQMPILPRGAPLTGYGRALDEAPARIRAGIKFLRAQGVNRIVLLGHGMGASMGSAYVARTTNSGVQGFIGLAMDAPVGRSELYKLDPRLHAPTMLARIHVPVLDVYGSLDRATVVDAAPQRAAAARKAGNTHYTQVKIENADHAFTRLDDDLVERISAWLDQQAARKSR